MSFTDELRKKLLPATEVYIQARERDYQEPIKRLSVINKEISTLRNPRNLSRARGSSSYGEMSRLVGRYEKFQQDADKANKKTKEQINKDLDNYAVDWDKEYGAVTTDAAGQAIRKVISDINAGNFDLKRLKNYLANENLFNKEKEQSERTFFALVAIKNGLKDEEDKAKIDGLMADLVKQKYPTDDRFKGQTSIDPQAWLSDYYPNLSTTSENGRKNRERILSRPQASKGPKGVAGAFHDQDVSEYKDYSKQITKYQGVLDGLLADQGLLSRSARPEQVSEFAQKISPIEEVDGKIAFKEDADPEEVAVFKKVLADEGLKEGSEYSKFVGSTYVKDAMSGLMSPDSTKRMMEKRAQELEQQREGLIQESVRSGRLSPAQLSVLTNPLFTRTGFRTAPNARLITSYRNALDRGFEIPELPSIDSVLPSDAPAEATEAPAEEAPAEAQVAYPGVGVLPAIQKTLDDAMGDLSEAIKSGNKDAEDAARVALGNVLEDFNELPDDLKSAFRSDVQPYLVSMEEFENKFKVLSPDGIDSIRKKLSIDKDVMEATGTVSDYMVNLGEEENRLPDFNSVSEFLVTHHERFPELYQGDMEAFKSSTGMDRDPSTAVLGDAGNGARNLLNETVSKGQFNADDADETLSTFTQLQGLAEKAAVSSRIRQQDESPEAPEGTEEQYEAPGKPADSYASPFDQETIAELAAEPQDEAPEVEIPELKSAEQSKAEQLAIAKAQQADYEASTSGAKAFAATAPRVDQDSYRHKRTPIAKQKAATLDDDAVVRDAFATMDVPAEAPEPPPTPAPKSTTPTGVPTGTVVGVTGAPTVKGVTEIAPADGAVASAYAPSPQDRARDDRAIASGETQPVLPHPSPDTPIVSGTPSKGAPRYPGGVQTIDGKVVPDEEAPKATEPDESAYASIEQEQSDDDAIALANQQEMDKQKRKALRDSTLDLFADIESKNIDFETAIAGANKINEVFNDVISPEYNMKMFKEISELFDKPVDQPESKPEEPVTKVAKLGFVSPVATEDTIDGAQVITSVEFGPRPDPNTGKVKDHKGIDLRARTGEPVFSVADGVVEKVDRTDNDGSGLNVSIRHADGSVTRYYHASAITEGLEIGTEVKAGQEIMKAGATGNVDGAHLHLELHKPNDKGELVAVNPLEHMGDLFSDFVIKKTGKTVAETYNTKVAGQGALPK